MDYRLIEFLARVPVCYKLHDGYTKYIARLAFNKRLPESIVWDKYKKGFPGPVEVWLREDNTSIRSPCDDLILEHNRFYSVKDVSYLDYIVKHDIGFYIRLLVTAIWYKGMFQENVKAEKNN